MYAAGTACGCGCGCVGAAPASAGGPYTASGGFAAAHPASSAIAAHEQMIIRIVYSSLPGCIVGQCPEVREIGNPLAGGCVMPDEGTRLNCLSSGHSDCPMSIQILPFSAAGRTRGNPRS